jgi:hypothetical protein
VAIEQKEYNEIAAFCKVTELKLSTAGLSIIHTLPFGHNHHGFTLSCEIHDGTPCLQAHAAPTRPRPRAGPPPRRDPCADSGAELPRSALCGGRGGAREWNQGGAHGVVTGWGERRPERRGEQERKSAQVHAGKEAGEIRIIVKNQN